MVFSERMFRNVQGDSSDPVSSWPHEVFTSILSYGGAPEYAPVLNEIFRSPWGPAARSVEEILAYTDPDDPDVHMDRGTFRLFEHGLAKARSEARAAERRDVAAELTRLVTDSGLTRKEFASRCGTSESRLSTYLKGSVSPRADFLVRARNVSADAAVNHPGRRLIRSL